MSGNYSIAKQPGFITPREPDEPIIEEIIKEDKIKGKISESSSGASSSGSYSSSDENEDEDEEEDEDNEEDNEKTQTQKEAAQVNQIDIYKPESGIFAETHRCLMLIQIAMATCIENISSFPEIHNVFVLINMARLISMNKHLANDTSEQLAQFDPDFIDFMEEHEI